MKTNSIISTHATRILCVLAAGLSLGVFAPAAVQAQWGITDTTAYSTPYYRAYSYISNLPISVWKVDVDQGGTFVGMAFESTDWFTPVVILSTEKLPLKENKSNQTYSWPKSADHLVLEAKEIPYGMIHYAWFTDLSPDKEYHLTILSSDEPITAHQSQFHTKRRIITVQSGGDVINIHEDGEIGHSEFSFRFHAVNHELDLDWVLDLEGAKYEFRDAEKEYDDFLLEVENKPYDPPVWDGIVPFYGRAKTGWVQLEAGGYCNAPTMEFENSTAPGFWLFLQSFGTYNYVHYLIERKAVWVDLPHETGMNPGFTLLEQEAYDIAVVENFFNWHGIEVEMGSLIQVRYE